MRRVLLSVLTLTAVAVPIVAVPAVAVASGQDVLQDCILDEQLSRTYTQKEYQQALELIPADGDQYTGCRAIIRAAQLQAAAGGTSGTGGTGGTGGATGTGGTTPLPPGVSPLAAASPADQAAAKKLQAEGSLPVVIAGSTIKPGDPGNVISSLDDLPPSLLVVLIGIAGALVAAVVHLVRTRAIDRPA